MLSAANLRFRLRTIERLDWVERVAHPGLDRL